MLSIRHGPLRLSRIRLRVTATTKYNLQNRYRHQSLPHLCRTHTSTFCTTANDAIDDRDEYDIKEVSLDELLSMSSLPNISNDDSNSPDASSSSSISPSDDPTNMHSKPHNRQAFILDDEDANVHEEDASMFMNDDAIEAEQEDDPDAIDISDDIDELEDIDCDVDDIIDDIIANPHTNIATTNTTSDNHNLAVINSLLKYDNNNDNQTNISHFEELNLRKRLQRNLSKIHKLSPLPIQSECLQQVRAARSDNVISGTLLESAMGSGKTLAYLLPIMNDLKPLHCGQSVIVVPTNELALQVKCVLKAYLVHHDDYRHNHATSSYLANNLDAHRVFSKWTATRSNAQFLRNRQYNVQHSVLACNSSDPLEYHIDFLRAQRPCVVIGTPKRIRELLLHSALKASQIEYLVFDECDAMFEVRTRNHDKDKKKLQKNKLHQQHVKAAQLILNGVVKQNRTNANVRQSVMFIGATIPGMLKNDLYHTMQPYPLQMMTGSETGGGASGVSAKPRAISPNITHQYIPVQSARDKFAMIAHLIRTIRENPKRRLSPTENPAILIFIERRSSPIEFAQLLSEYDLKCALLHEHLSDKSQRSKFLKLFRNGTIDVVVASNAICRGLDFIWLDHVIVANVPRRADDDGHVTYLHICGRASRLGSKGYVTAVCEESEEHDLKYYAFKSQIELVALDHTVDITKTVGKQHRKYNKYNTFPLLLQNSEYNQRLKKKLYLTATNKNKIDDSSVGL